MTTSPQPNATESRWQHWAAALLAVSFPLMGAKSLAQGSAGHQEAGERPLWELRLGAFGRNGPAYPAARDSQVDFVPLPFPIYRGKILRVGDDTEKPVRTRLLRWNRVKLDIDFGLNFPVDSNEIAVRTGMPDLDLLLEAGPELEVQFEPQLMGGNLYLAGQLRGAVSMDGLSPDWRGVVLSAELRHKRPVLNERTELSTRLTPEWASNDYMDFFYGVAPAFAAPGRDAYRARSGYLGTKLSFVLKHDFTDNFETRFGVRFGFHQGASNRNSPLFTRDTNSSVYIALLWKFWESKRRDTGL